MGNRWQRNHRTRICLISPKARHQRSVSCGTAHMQSLMDLRFIHLINASLSDERHAGRRSEVYMLDLSQFSGTRFKRNLKVLDFTKGHLVLKSTGVPAPPRPGDTPKKLQGIYAAGPYSISENLRSSSRSAAKTAFYVTPTPRLGAEPNRNDSRFRMRTPLCDSK